MANKPLQSIKFPGLSDTYTTPQVDATLTTTGAAADAKKVGDEITSIKQDLSEIVPGLSDDAKSALLACFEHVAWVDEHGQDYYDALESALYQEPSPSAELVSISATFNAGSNVIYDTTPLNDLKQYLTVIGTYSDSTTAQISSYSLSGTLSAGSNTITVTKGEITTTFTVIAVAYWQLDWIYTKGLPENNGLTKETDGTATISLESNGLRVIAEDTSGKNVKYKYTGISDQRQYNYGEYELEFIVNAYGSYSVAPYGNGVRMYAALGANNAAKGLELTFNSGGTLYLKANVTNWAILDSTAFALDTLYKVKVTLNRTEAKVYVDDTLIGTVSAADIKEELANPYFIAYRGVDVTFKSFKVHVEQ